MGSASYPPCPPHPWLRFHSACVVSLSTISFADKPLSLSPLSLCLPFSLYLSSSSSVSLFIDTWLHCLRPLATPLFLAVPRYPCHLARLCLDIPLSSPSPTYDPSSNLAAAIRIQNKFHVRWLCANGTASDQLFGVYVRGCRESRDRIGLLRISRDQLR